MKTKFFQSASVMLCAAFVSLSPNLATASPLPAATYLFNNNLNAQESGVAALTATNPLGTSGFNSDTVFGQTRTVYSFNGNATPVNEQAGLSLDTTGLVTSNNYSVEMVFQFTQRNNAWRRVIDVQDRQSDTGLYINPSNQLAIFPVTGGANFTNNVYHDIFLVNSAGTAYAYIDGTLSFSTATTLMDISNAGNLMNFFLDNTASTGQGEYSNGSVAKISLYSGALTATDVANIASNPFAPASSVPEPSDLSLVGIGLAGIFFAKRSPRRIGRA